MRRSLVSSTLSLSRSISVWLRVGANRLASSRLPDMSRSLATCVCVCVCGWVGVCGAIENLSRGDDYHNLFIG